MDINNLPSNSHKSKNIEQKEEKKFESVVSNKTTKKKKSELTKFANSFVSEDIHTVKNYIFSDVIIPALKNLISEIVKDGIDALLFGSTAPRKKSSGTTTSYRSYYEPRASKVTYSPDKSNLYDYDDIIFESRGDAEKVLMTMNEALERYGVVTVADYYDISGQKFGNYTDNNYGWKTISNARVERVKDGHVIRFPKVSPIE